jgi:hypothetical protein
MLQPENPVSVEQGQTDPDFFRVLEMDVSDEEAAYGEKCIKGVGHRFDETRRQES